VSGPNARAIYGEGYADRYEDLYLHPWLRKHEANRQHLATLLAELPVRGRWLDLACGQAWHFSRFPGFMAKIGIDLSLPQLRRAKRNATDAAFVQADICEIEFPAGWFDLVTNFWAGYCYLNSRRRIEALVRKAAGWVRPGGAVYFDVLPPEHLASFNDSRYAAQTGFRVTPRTPDYEAWTYQDLGGLHRMTSVSAETFVQWLSPSFRIVEVHHHGGFMLHVVASDKIGRQPRSRPTWFNAFRTDD
jgi:SAM-dependent methyltransferase